MEQRCPRCSREKPPSAGRCACGWDFAAGRLTGQAAVAEASALSAEAWASWTCPVVAWGSQAVLNLTLRGVPGMGPVWLLAGIIQLALIVAGLYLGGKILSLGRDAVPKSARRAAIVGVALSGGTILLIVAVAVASSL